VHEIGIHRAAPNAELPTDEKPTELDRADNGRVR